jgi:pimeloyl-ACP methyl ester carboxylesterase
MPNAQIAPDLAMHYEIDDYTDPWTTPETVLLLHGNAESSTAWYAWVPHLARHYRVVRPDMRGFGRSTPMARDYAWSFERIIDDFVALTGRLGIARFHLVGAKIGGTIALRFAARETQRVASLTVLGSPASGQDALGDRAASWLDHLEKHGVESWARWTMPGRLGSRFPAEGAEWWAKLMGRTPRSTQLGFISGVPAVDVTPDLPKIACPTLVVTTDGSGLGSVESTRAWQQKIPRSELLVVPGDSYHVAATDADRCAAATFAFIRRASARETRVPASP